MFQELELQLDQPLQSQIYRFISQGIIEQRLLSATRLPSSRQLAGQLRISRNTVNAAYEQLRVEGFIVSRAGSGWYVNTGRSEDRIDNLRMLRQSTAEVPQQSKLAERLNEPKPSKDKFNLPFTPGLPDLSCFPLKQWNRLCRQNESRTALMGYGDPQGQPELREQIATYLRESRGVFCQPEQILVTQGAQQALNVVFSLLLDPGDTVLIEEPGYRGTMKAAQMTDAVLQPVPVNEDGLKVSSLPPNTQAKLLYCTPTHQYPLGGILDVSERLQLLEWSKRNQLWIVEDDYDSEFHFYQKPFPAMHSLVEQASVIYLGSFSKTLFPALRTGYLVLPESLMPAAVAIKEYMQGNSPLLNQAVLAQFMADGHFKRHLRRMRYIYQQKWELLLQQWQQQGNHQLLKPVVQSAGMHIVLTGEVDEGTLQQKLAAHGFGCTPLSYYFLNPPWLSGLVLGYANASESDIRALVQLLNENTTSIPC